MAHHAALHMQVLTAITEFWQLLPIAYNSWLTLRKNTVFAIYRLCCNEIWRIQYGRWMKKNSVFFNFNHELWAIGRSCQTSVTAVRNYICRATWWAIVPIYPPMLQWNMADPRWPINGKMVGFFSAILQWNLADPIWPMNEKKQCLF